ncbi:MULTISPECIES: hypothetical protein [Phyllobacterium]|nr:MULTISPECIES: hypothetical protein [Phyllobacterium]SFJ16577.1 hypothetical protein SAMN04515648_2960 [Phyllobacterium sp. CL33Tsu]
MWALVFALGLVWIVTRLPLLLQIIVAFVAGWAALGLWLGLV